MITQLKPLNYHVTETITVRDDTTEIAKALNFGIAYGTGAVGGFTNTAQHARYWESGARDTFILEVACANGSCLQ